MRILVPSHCLRGRIQFGVDHINTADTVNELGRICSHWRREDDAMAEHNRGLKIQEKAFGVDYINTADAIIEIGYVYFLRRKEEEAAEEEVVRAFRIQQKGLEIVTSRRIILGYPFKAFVSKNMRPSELGRYLSY